MSICESNRLHLLKKTALLSFADILKQKGYLLGMVLSYAFYKTVEFFDILDKQTQVYILHGGLFLLQIVILLFVFQTFNRR